MSNMKIYGYYLLLIAHCSLLIAYYLYNVRFEKALSVYKLCLLVFVKIFCSRQTFLIS